MVVTETGIENLTARCAAALAAAAAAAASVCPVAGRPPRFACPSRAAPCLSDTRAVAHRLPTSPPLWWEVPEDAPLPPGPATASEDARVKPAETKSVEID